MTQCNKYVILMVLGAVITIVSLCLVSRESCRGWTVPTKEVPTAKSRAEHPGTVLSGPSDVGRKVGDVDGFQEPGCSSHEAVFKSIDVAFYCGNPKSADPDLSDDFHRVKAKSDELRGVYDRVKDDVSIIGSDDTKSVDDYEVTVAKGKVLFIEPQIEWDKTASRPSPWLWNFRPFDDGTCFIDGNLETRRLYLETNNGVECYVVVRRHEKMVTASLIVEDKPICTLEYTVEKENPNDYGNTRGLPMLLKVMSRIPSR